MYEDYEPEPEPEFEYIPPPEYQKREEFVGSARVSIVEFFRWRNAPFHFRQLQVLFETQYFHIATAQALYSLINDGFLQPIPFTAGANYVTFVVPTRIATVDSHTRILQSHMKSKAKIISLYDSPEISKDLGYHFESLVKMELRANQLNIVSTSTNTYKNRQWVKSKANLDIIADYPDGRAFGIQAKNELKSIEKDELLEQLEICQFLGVKPVFIVRYMPWSFVPIVTAQGGFVLTIGTQLWPLGYRTICEQIQDKLSVTSGKVSEKLKTLAPKMRTQWPIVIATEIPEDARNRLSYWLKTGKFPPRK